ncbi:hypothetical protein ABKV19_017285 [Rosa sericea]
MNTYSISHDDYDTVVELSKFQGHPNPLDGVQLAVKAALTKAYKEGSKSRMVRIAEFVTFPGMKKAPKKRIAAILEPSDNVTGENNDDTLVPNEEENSSDTEDLGMFYHFQIVADTLSIFTTLLCSRTSLALSYLSPLSCYRK